MIYYLSSSLMVHGEREAVCVSEIRMTHMRVET